MSYSISEEIVDIIDLIYEFGLQRDKWTETLDNITKFIRFETYSVVEAHQDERVCSRLYDNFETRKFWNEMSEYYKYLAPIANFKKTNRYFEIFYDYMQIDEEETSRNEFYDWVNQHGVKYQLAARLSPISQGPTIHLSLRRSGIRGHATPEEIEILSVLRTHMERALSMSHLLDRNRADWVTVDALMESASVGLAMISVDGHLTKSNGWFDKVIGGSSGVEVCNGRIVIARSALQREFDRKLGRVLAGRKNRTEQQGQSLMFRPSPLDPTKVTGIQLYPITTRAAFEIGTEDAVILLIQNSSSISRKAKEAFSSTHGLTPRETSILEYLLLGHSLERFAEEHAISANTVRWHMQNILNKTGYKSQGQLINSARSMLFFD